MRILFFNYEYPPLGGGAGNATYYILREFAKIPDLKLDLVTSSINDKYHLENIDANIRIHRLPIGKNSRNLHFQSQRDLLVYAWKAFWFARKLIRENNYDLSHSFFTVPCGFLSLVCYRLYKIPYIVSLRGADVPGYSERFSLLYKIIAPLAKKIWRRSAAVVANSAGLRNLALKTNPEQEISQIYNGIDTNEFKPNNQSSHSMSPFRIICVSRITARKGIKYLIEAVAKLKAANLSLEIIGEGDEKEALEKLVKEMKLENMVQFVGLVEHSQLPELYCRADVFVLPSLNEGMSNTLLEALASGLPIIATNTGGTKELIRENANGFIIKTKDSNDIAEKLEKLIVNPELVRSMGIESRRIAEQMSWKKVAEQYLELYKKVM